MEDVVTTAGQGDTETTGSKGAVEAKAPEQAAPVSALATKASVEPTKQPESAKQPEQPQKYSSMFDEKPEAKASGETDAGDADGGDGTKPAEGDIDITLPDGAVADAEAMGILKGVAKETGLSKEQAQKLADAHMAAMRRYDEHRISSGLETIQKWEDEIKAHPEFGGANLEKNADAAKLMLQKYGSPRLRQEFSEMGVLSHPEFAYMLMRMSRDLSEGESIGGQGQAMPEKDAASVLFGDDVK